MAQAQRKRQARAAPAPVTHPDWVVLGLAVAGIAVSAYLTVLKLTGTGAALCVAGSGCDIVQASRYAMFLWVPTALWGALVYAALGVLAWLGLAGGKWLTAFVLASGGVGFSLYLTALSIWDLGATCVWCLTSAVLMTAIFLLVLRKRPASVGRTGMRPARLATYAVVGALGAVVVGAFVYAAPFSAPVGYAGGLARHLAQSKAVMYGAFW
jgi:uncharacterized membrane protein